MEYSHRLMNPKSENCQLWIAVKLVENVNTLNHLADISHVENVVRLGWCWQKCIRNWVVQTYRRHCQCLSHLLNLIIKILSEEFVRQNVMEDPPDLGLWRESEIDHDEFSLNTTWDFVTSSSRWTHWWDKLNVFYFFENFILDSIEPSSVIHPLSEKFQGRLRSVSVFFGHVEVINVDDHFFAVRNHLGFGSSGHFTFNHVLSLFAWCLRREDDVGDFPGILIQLWENLVNENCFTCASDTDTESMNFVIDTVLENVFGSLWIDGWDN